MTTRRCQACSTLEKPVFYDKTLPECPECGVSKYGLNTAIRAGMLNRHLDAAAAGVPYDGPVV